MAERLCKKILKEGKITDIKVSSKGINAKGENIAENAKVVLKEMGALASNRKSVQLKKIDKKTIYIAMTETIKNKLSEGNVISSYGLIGCDILDPYMQDLEIYRKTAKQLQQMIYVLLDKILKARGE